MPADRSSSQLSSHSEESRSRETTTIRQPADSPTGAVGVNSAYTTPEDAVHAPPAACPATESPVGVDLVAEELEYIDAAVVTAVQTHTVPVIELSMGNATGRNTEQYIRRYIAALDDWELSVRSADAGLWVVTSA